MENPQNINLKINEEKNNSYRNSELISISNKETDFKINSKYDNQLKISNNEETRSHPSTNTMLSMISFIILFIS